jgi:hypothetical protein
MGVKIDNPFTTISRPTDLRYSGGKTVSHLGGEVYQKY